MDFPKLADIPSEAVAALRNTWPVFELYSSKSQKRFDAIAKFRTFLSQKNPPIDECVQLDVLPQIVELVKNHDYPAIQYEAASVLRIICSGMTMGASENVQSVINAGAIAVLIDVLKFSKSDDVVDEVLGALGAIAGNSTECRDAVLNANILEPLTRLLVKSNCLDFLRLGAWTIANLSCNSPAPSFERIRVCLPALVHLVHVSDSRVLRDTCKTLRNIIDDSSMKIRAIIDAGICEQLVLLLG